MIKAKHVQTGQDREFGDIQWKVLPTIKNGALAGTKAGYVPLDANDATASVAKTFIPPELKAKSASPVASKPVAELPAADDVTGTPEKSAESDAPVKAEKVKAATHKKAGKK